MPQTTPQIATVAVVGKEIIDEVVEHAPKFIPPLILEDFEVCRQDNTSFECILIISGEKRRVPMSRVSCALGSVCMTEESFLRLLAALEVYCAQDEIKCEKIAEEYKNINRIYIVGG